jgi:flavin reductase (DIM6/NTAB) family NADH-FMN oxidoreductase RutF
MVVGSFTSVSLDPPLIAFYPAKSSTSWPKIQSAGSFCVNILGADQDHICRAFSASGTNKFEKVSFHMAPHTGSPIIDGVVAWIDCGIDVVRDAGDHVLVMGRVLGLDMEAPRLPLLFFQGGYGRFLSLSLTAPNESGSLTTPLRHVDLIRPVMEAVARDLRCRCLAGSRIGDEVIVVASDGHSRDVVDTTTLVGQRLPFLPPSGSVFAAWAPESVTRQWLQHAPSATWEQHLAALRLVRERGCSLGLMSPAQRNFASALDAMAQEPTASWHTTMFGLMPQLSYDPPDLAPQTLDRVRQVTAPVFDAEGKVALALTAFGFGSPRGGVTRVMEVLQAAAATATRRIGGRSPAP